MIPLYLGRLLAGALVVLATVSLATGTDTSTGLPEDDSPSRHPQLWVIEQYFAPPDTITVSAAVVEKMMYQYGIYRGYEGVQWWMLDSQYKLLTLEGLKEVLRYTLEDSPRVKDWKDCDDFAINFAAKVREHFRVNSIGIVFTRRHAFNVALLQNGTLYVIEPELGLYWPYYRRDGGLYELAEPVLILM